jgi:class 3 adenylate cyclase
LFCFYAQYGVFLLLVVYLQMVRIIASGGGDVFKFAGDAMIVLWPEGDLAELAHRAMQAAIEIMSELDKTEMEAGVILSVKIGIGVGDVSVLHIGGVYGRREYCAVGQPLVQAFQAEHHAEPGQIIISKQTWTVLGQIVATINAKTFDDGCRLFDYKGDPTNITTTITFHHHQQLYQRPPTTTATNKQHFHQRPYHHQQTSLSPM